MRYTPEQLRKVLSKTRRMCHLCHQPLSIRGYGRNWHVDHLIPKVKGGTDHLNNLFVACVTCNCSKRDGSNRGARAFNGKQRSPLSPREHSKAVTDNTLLGGFAGALGGAWLLGPFGFWAGMLIGAAMGNGVRVDS